MTAFSDERPVLPSLHSLGLLALPSKELHNALDDSDEKPKFPVLHIPLRQRLRQVSTTSSATSRSPSPQLIDLGTSSSREVSHSIDTNMSAPSTPILSISPLSPPTLKGHIPTNAPPLRFRLEPCALQEAQAIVVIPPPNAPFIPSSSMPITSQKQQALLLLGSSLEHFRQSDKHIAKGARIHPYRIAPSQRKGFERSQGSMSLFASPL